EREDGMVEWRVSAEPVDYRAAEAEQEARAAAVAAGRAEELVWLLEHPPLYTAGPRAREGDLLEPGRFPVYETRRGGEFTYHGPGQRVVYAVLDLNRRGRDVRAYVASLEDWIIATLAGFGVAGERRAGRIGVWVARPGGREEKIAAIGVRLRRWVAYHGIALNVAPDLSHFEGIVACGLREHGVTSLAALGVSASIGDVDAALRAEFARRVLNGKATQAAAE
ncbi:MAG: lipoyl(octanoyl) transferase LipB, partial [Pseudomonadota bacterium]